MKKIILLSSFVTSLFYSASVNAQLIDIQFNGLKWTPTGRQKVAEFKLVT